MSGESSVIDKEEQVGDSSNSSEWLKWRDDEIMQQQTAIQEEEAIRRPFVGDKEPISALEAEYESGNSIILAKIQLLNEKYAAIRRTRGDGNCFFRCFMFSYLEHLLETQDRAEVDRIKIKVDQCKKTLSDLGFLEFTFEDFFEIFIESLNSVIGESCISHDELLTKCRDAQVSDYVVMFFRFITMSEIRQRSEFFEPFITGLSNCTVDRFCKTSVEPMGEESDHVHIIALTDALGVPIRIVYLDRSTCESGGPSLNHHDFIPAAGNSEANNTPVMTLLYRPGHYDILYLK